MNRKFLSRPDNAAVILLCRMLMTLMLTFSVSVYGDEVEDSRVRIAMEIFPRIVAVDEDIQNKLTATNKIRLFIVYDHDAYAARQIADNMKNSFSNIAGRAVEFVVENAVQTIKEGMHHASAVFVSELLTDEIFSVFLKLAVAEHILVFSPFAGDVERGATVGIAISSRIKPYFNLATLGQSRISINEKLLSISPHHE